MNISYVNNGPLDCTIEPDLKSLKDKSVLVTGGSSGLGAAYTKGFSDAGAYVTFADINNNQDLAALPKTQYVKCDVRNWSQQVSAFKSALNQSPYKAIDIVVANAGVLGPESIFNFEEGEEPIEPDLRVVSTNFIGVAYTTKLALHYFNKQSNNPTRDRCLILKSSTAAYIDVIGSPCYESSKFAVRGIMRSLRRTGRLRVNCVSPWSIETPILDSTTIKQFAAALAALGSSFAQMEDSVKAVMRIASDNSINGRSLGVVPRGLVESGYVDLDQDDYKEGEVLEHLQQVLVQLMTPPSSTEQKDE